MIEGSILSNLFTPVTLRPDLAPGARRQPAQPPVRQTTQSAITLRSQELQRNRSAFKTTISELTDMPIAAIHGASMPVAANGSASEL